MKLRRMTLLENSKKKLGEKLREALGAVLPIMGIMLLLCFTIAPMPNSILMAFIIGAILLIVGMMFFTLEIGRAHV